MANWGGFSSAAFGPRSGSLGQERVSLCWVSTPGTTALLPRGHSPRPALASPDELTLSHSAGGGGGRFGREAARTVNYNVVYFD